jgi:peptidyl-dipeptidase A
VTDGAKAFLDRVVPEIEGRETAANLAYWEFSRTGAKEAEERYSKLSAELRRLFSDREAFAELRSLLAAGRKWTPLVRRQLVLLHHAYLPNQLDEATIGELVRREAGLESLFANFRATLEGRRLSDNELRTILRAEDDQARRKAAWAASKEIGAAAAPKVVELVELRNGAARRLGYSDYYQLSLATQELAEGELFALLDRVERVVREPFRQAKADLDARLARRFRLAPADLRPWHYDDPFFQAVRQSEVDLDRYFAGQDVVELARRYYEGIGLDVQDVLARSDLYERPGKNQHAFCTHLDRSGDVRILANVRPDAQWAETMLHELGHAVYDKYLDFSLPYLLRRPAHLLATEAVAMLCGRLVTDERWLVRVRGLSEAEAGALAGAARSLLRLNELIFVRWGLVVVLFERELYRNPRQDLNRLWREKVESLQFLTYPADRNTPDWAAKIHLATAPVYYQNYLLGTLTASQLKWAVERLVGQDALIGNPATGRFFVERLFRPGASRPWEVTLTLATGEPLNSDRFVADFITP